MSSFILPIALGLAAVSIFYFDRELNKAKKRITQLETKIKRLEAQLGTQGKKTPRTLGRPSQRRDSSNSS